MAAGATYADDLVLCGLGDAFYGSAGPRGSVRRLSVRKSAGIHPGRAIDLTLQHVFDCGDELAGCKELLDESRGARSNERVCQLRIGVQRQHDNLGARALEPHKGLQDAHARHGDVGHDHVRAQPCGRVDELLTVGDGGDDIEPIREQVDETMQHEGVVVRDEDSRSFHLVRATSSSTVITDCQRPCNVFQSPHGKSIEPGRV